MRRLLAAAVVTTAVVAGCGGGGDSQPDGRGTETLTVTSGGEGGIYFVYGAAYAKVISRHLPGFREITFA